MDFEHLPENVSIFSIDAKSLIHRYSTQAEYEKALTVVPSQHRKVFFTGQANQLLNFEQWIPPLEGKYKLLAGFVFLRTPGLKSSDYLIITGDDED